MLVEEALVGPLPFSQEQMSEMGQSLANWAVCVRSAFPLLATRLDVGEVRFVPLSDNGRSDATLVRYHVCAITSFQNRKRIPTVGAMLLRWRKPKANPLFTCVNMIPE
jgi:hypothetical protein